MADIQIYYLWYFELFYNHLLDFYQHFKRLANTDVFNK